MKEAIERRKAMEAEWAELGHPATACVGHGLPLPDCPAPGVHARKAQERGDQVVSEEPDRILRGLVASLERVKMQRARSLELARTRADRAGISGEITGLIIAINAIKRRLR